MRNKTKAIIVIIVFAILIGGGYFLYRFLHDTQLNADDVNGNFSGNLLNDGTFCEYEGKVYFANPEDSDHLYVMNPDGSDKKLLVKDSVRSINVCGKYIYYTRIDSHEGTNFAFMNVDRYSLCRSDLDGNNTKILDGDPCMAAALVGNYIYYIHYDKQDASTFRRVHIDGRDKGEMSPNAYNPSGVSGTTIYYNELEGNHNIMALDTKTMKTSTIFEGNCSNIIVKDNCFYFMNNANGYAVTRVPIGSGKTDTLVNKRVDCFNVSDKYIYYQTVGNNPSFCRCPIGGGEEEIIASGNFCDINVTSTYTYFRLYGTNKVYKIPANEAGHATDFDK
ncbi:MAG: DUF5050 domain-containing protein [Lachnospiraceae bacterium]|nr:DUF5050 domain-containing protein [Lachnospiraceae bacterium]